MSPKNKGTFGKAKTTAVEPTDEFISGIDRILRALKPHAVRLAVIVGAVVVVVVVYTSWNWWQDRKLAGATTLYLRAVALSHVPVDPSAEDEASPDPADKKAPDPAKQDAPKRERPPDPRNLPEKFASADERASAVAAALDELSSEYGSTSVAAQGLLLHGEALYELGRYADAAERYRAYAEAGGPEELVLAAREGLAYSLESQAMAEKDDKTRAAGLEKALKAFQEMQPRADGPRHDEALYHQARVQAELGRKEEARKTLEQILADHPDSSLKQDIDMRLPALRASK